MSKKPSYNANPAGRAPSKKRMMLFKLISIVMPFLILLILEIFLRLFHYGFNPALFIESSDENYLVLNPAASKKYFLNQAIATTGNTELFKKEKDENTLRIFVLGESTTIGYPYFHNGSFHRWLLYRLMHSFPDKNFEIINLSLTAVNSYTVLGFAKEIVNYQPDAVMIYTGHNEYYGALGVGSTGKMVGGPALVNIALSLRQLKLVQLMTNTYEKIAGAFGRNNSYRGKARMEFMVADQQIPYSSAVFNRGLAQFKSNLDGTLELLNEHHIPVLISNLVSNEKELRPFVDINPDSLEYPSFQKNYWLAIQALSGRDSTAALAYFTVAQREYPFHASCNYYLGRMAYSKGNYQEARGYFQKATDLDALRFRAPSQVNVIIAQLCKLYPYAHLVNTKAVFDSASRGHIIGEELILEHVHPNLKGYALLSDAFYNALKTIAIMPMAKEHEMSFEKLLQNMPITSMDSLTGEFRIDHLRKSWPFSNGPAQPPNNVSLHTEEEKLAFGITFQKMNWADATQELYRYYINNHDLASAKILAETLVLEHPTEEPYYTNAANICGERKDYDNAVFYFKKSFAFSPSFDKAKYLFVMYFMLDKPEEAMPFLDYAISNGPSSLRNVKTQAIEIMQLKKKYLKNDSINIAVLNQVAGKYFKMGNKEASEKYVQKVLRVDMKNKEALSLLSQLNASEHEKH